MVENLVVLLPEAIVTYFKLGIKWRKYPNLTAYLVYITLNQAILSEGILR